MEATITSEDELDFLGVRAAFVRVEVVERKGIVVRTLGVVVLGDLVTFRFDDGREVRHAVRRMDVSLFHEVVPVPIAELPAALVPFAQKGTGGEIGVAVRAFRRGERVRLVSDRKIEELA